MRIPNSYYDKHFPNSNVELVNTTNLNVRNDYHYCKVLDGLGRVLFKAGLNNPYWTKHVNSFLQKYGEEHPLSA